MPKSPKVTEQVIKRVKKANFNQARHSPCLACGKNFEDCPHSMLQIDVIISVVQVLDSI